MSSHANQAKNNLVYYMRLLAKKSGVGWDYDNDCEIETIVDDIIEAAAEQAAKKVLRALPANVQE
ncbi:MAG: hypothetical protein IT328_27910 [Caldilineaceae bacterium]|nr:hypothetical protein [Caldilineaceae bacterium]